MKGTAKADLADVFPAPVSNSYENRDSAPIVAIFAPGKSTRPTRSIYERTTYMKATDKHVKWIHDWNPASNPPQNSFYVSRWKPYITTKFVGNKKDEYFLTFLDSYERLVVLGNRLDQKNAS